MRVLSSEALRRKQTQRGADAFQFKWYKRRIYAPGFYTGYGVKTLPGAHDAIEWKNWPEVVDENG